MKNRMYSVSIFLVTFLVTFVVSVVVNKSDIHLSDGTVFSVSAGLMAVCATFIVGWQILSYFSIGSKFEQLEKEKKRLDDSIRQLERKGQELEVALEQSRVDRTEFAVELNKLEKDMAFLVDIGEKVKENKKLQKVTEYYAHYSIGLSHFGFREYTRSFRAFNCALLRALELNDNELNLRLVNQVLDKLQNSAQLLPEDQDVTFRMSLADLSEVYGSIQETHDRILANKFYNEIEQQYNMVYALYCSHRVYGGAILSLISY